MTALGDYLTRLDAQKVLLVEIDPSGTPIYLADTAYVTEPGDTPASTIYHPVIAQDGVPRLSRRIQDLRGGRSVPAWGPLNLASAIAGATDLSSAAIRGLPISVLITGPRSMLARSAAGTVLGGVVGTRSGNVDGGLTMQVLDRQAGFEDIVFPPNVYDGTETANFPASNIGKVKPICMGRCRGVSLVLIDTANLVYQFNDAAAGACNAVLNIYDNGVALTQVGGAPAAGQYSVNLTAGTITLGGSTVGVLTGDIEGVKSGATWLDGTDDLVDWLAQNYGGLSASETDITGLPTDVIGYFADSQQRLADVITALMRGVLGWWGFDRSNVLRARIFEAPTTGGNTFGQTQHLSDITWTEDEPVFWAVPYLYQRNWTRIEQPASSVSLNTVARLRSEGATGRREQASILSTYAYARVADRLDTYFDTVTPAQTVADRALVLFGVPRERTKVTVPFVDPPLELGDNITLQDADHSDGDHLIIGIVERWDGEIPVVDLELWA